MCDASCTISPAYFSTITNRSGKDAVLLARHPGGSLLLTSFPFLFQYAATPDIRGQRPLLLPYQPAGPIGAVPSERSWGHFFT